MGELETLKLTRDRPGIGNRLVEVDSTTAVLHQARSGKLFLCKCEKSEWECRQEGNDTWCLERCVIWDCKEVPAPATNEVKR